MGKFKIPKLPGLSYEETIEVIPPNTILLGYVGSISHGTHIPSNDPDGIDDVDIMGVCIAGEQVYLGLKNFEQKEKKYNEWDSVVYEIRKFFRLLLKQNPNVLGLLYLQPTNYLFKDEAGQLIIDNRSLFVSKEAYHSFVGYAHGQLHRMTHGAFLGYMGEKRKRLVAEFGYDCKNAAHLIRLLRMGIEYLTDGTLRVFREDAHELKEIKTGKWSLERVQREAGDLFKLAQEAYVRSPLPPSPNYSEAERLLIKILRTYFSLKTEDDSGR
jgi:predicted nucleotidyltransferase